MGGVERMTDGGRAVQVLTLTAGTNFQRCWRGSFTSKAPTLPHGAVAPVARGVSRCLQRFHQSKL